MQQSFKFEIAKFELWNKIKDDAKQSVKYYLFLKLWTADRTGQPESELVFLLSAGLFDKTKTGK